MLVLYLKKFKISIQNLIHRPEVSVSRRKRLDKIWIGVSHIEMKTVRHIDKHRNRVTHRYRYEYEIDGERGYLGAQQHQDYEQVERYAEQTNHQRKPAVKSRISERKIEYNVGWNNNNNIAWRIVHCCCCSQY